MNHAIAIIALCVYMIGVELSYSEYHDIDPAHSVMSPGEVALSCIVWPLIVPLVAAEVNFKHEQRLVQRVKP